MEILRAMIKVSNNSCLTGLAATVLEKLPKEDQRVIEEWLRHVVRCHENDNARSMMLGRIR